MQDRVPLTSVSLNCWYFSEGESQCVAGRSNGSWKKNLGILVLPLLFRAVSNCANSNLYRHVQNYHSSYLFMVLIYLYSCIQSSQGHKTMTAVA